MAKMSHQLVGNAGLYFVCYQLTRRGWNVLPTSRNAKGVDIVMYDASGERMHTVEVKALSKRDPVGISPGPPTPDFLIVCRKVCEPAPEMFIMRGAEVARLIQDQKDRGKTSFWIEIRDYEPYQDRWDLIGMGHST